jgi:hypothetical protein
MKEKKTRAISSEEFALEFGDVNGTKLYEFPYSPKKDHKKRLKKK